MIPITRNQIIKIHVLRARLGWTDENYRAALSGWPASGFRDRPAQSCKDLDCSAAAQLIQRMEGLIPAPAPTQPQGGKGRLKYEELGHRPGMASPAQLRYVEALWAGVSRQPDAESRAKALLSFVQRQCCVSALEWLEPRHIQVLINTMQQMLASKKQREAA